MDIIAIIKKEVCNDTQVWMASQSANRGTAGGTVPGVRPMRVCGREQLGAGGVSVVTDVQSQQDLWFPWKRETW